ncbi:hypothetical protein F1559_001495 [Cyanidiococcus yangmingshanensis]|uniref:Uncharacterized protein n=1 Tax=Cyanidiococcus yangmingshanensis TaxID=2690220 RepID=A0A7J7IHF5_9RHOD|nr:hypothetical protein F1559_001495 [Cyanidiococcus yangmingshanensis]
MSRMNVHVERNLFQSGNAVTGDRQVLQSPKHPAANTRSITDLGCAWGLRVHRAWTDSNKCEDRYMDEVLGSATAWIGVHDGTRWWRIPGRDERFSQRHSFVTQSYLNQRADQETRT